MSDPAVVGSAAPFVPERLSLSGLQEAAQACRGCALYQRATQTVFGEGLVRSEVMIVGEQPGDREDREGHPFVGPAGRVLRQGLRDVGIADDRTYITNVVKHFKWEAKGKRRIHQRPGRGEIEACRPWIDAELEVISPRAVLLLGATAAKAMLGEDFRVTRDRGRLLETEYAPVTVATVHPSSVLRAGDDRHAAMEHFVDDLRSLASALN